MKWGTPFSNHKDATNNKIHTFFNFRVLNQDDICNIMYLNQAEYDQEESIYYDDDLEHSSKDESDEYAASEGTEEAEVVNAATIKFR